MGQVFTFASVGWWIIVQVKMLHQNSKGKNLINGTADSCKLFETKYSFKTKYSSSIKGHSVSDYKIPVLNFIMHVLLSSKARFVLHIIVFSHIP